MVVPRCQFGAKTNLPVEANGKKTETLVPITSTKHCRDGRVVRKSEAQDREACEEWKYPFREKFPYEDPRNSEVNSVETLQLNATYAPKTM
jgi:hypothetical protein